MFSSLFQLLLLKSSSSLQGEKAAALVNKFALQMQVLGRSTNLSLHFAILPLCINNCTDGHYFNCISRAQPLALAADDIFLNALASFGTSLGLATVGCPTRRTCTTSIHAHVLFHPLFFSFILSSLI